MGKSGGNSANVGREEIMNRAKMIQTIEEYPDEWDIIIIGGGATGLGAAVDSAARGFRTLLLEQSDFAKATSSRSTKLIHGGLRYLQQGNIALVTEALKERGLLCRNAPHLVHHLPFLVPNYKWWEGPFYGVGLKIYDMLAGELGLEPSRFLSRRETLRAIPTLEPRELRGGVMYYDGQFDDSRLAITLARTLESLGGVAINYMRVTELIKKKGLCAGVKAKDKESGKTYQLHAKVVINATGIFSDDILRMDTSRTKDIIAPSQGIHIVLPQKFQPSQTAILVPHTEDNRVLFMVPWHDRVLLGTTDTPVTKTTLEPKPHPEEIAFLLKHAKRYLVSSPSEKDILSVFAGLRPLIKVKEGKNTASLSRDHVIFVSKSKLITIAGGKWTTYRKMGEDVINKALVVGSLPNRSSITATLHLQGWQEGVSLKDPLSAYGSEAKLVKSQKREGKKMLSLLHPRLPYIEAAVLWAVRREMACTVEDVLSRRTRSLLLDARASLEAAPRVAKIMASELGQNQGWERKQVQEYTKLAKNYFYA
jgi:glycerol-3-phosphate dehydrogenase